MASIEVTITGVLYDKLQRTTQQVVLIGDASLSGVGIGGGPIIPPGQSQPPYPSHPIYNPGGPPGSSPPGFWGGGMGPGVKPQPRPEHPIYLPPNCPPELQPPTPPNPGDPTTVVPPPEGSGGWPVQPITVPDYMVVWYPGVGPVVVAPPASGGTASSASSQQAAPSTTKKPV